MQFKAKITFNWGTILSILLTIGWFCLLQGLWNGWVFGGLEKFYLDIIMTGSVLLPILAVVKFYSGNILLKVLDSGSPMEAVLREQLKEALQETAEKEANASAFTKFYREHITTVYMVAFLVLVYLNGWYLAAVAYTLSFILGEISKRYTAKIQEKVNA